MDASRSSPSLSKHSHPYATRSQTSSTSSSTSASHTNSSYFAPTSAAATHHQQHQMQSNYGMQPAPSQQQAQAMGGQQATSPFLRDFNLVAEAAKRAQMACLMRDMEAVGLS
ncbi:hypothetical protein BP6252_03195 [Coleophoma cylindrospora]|uniref:Thiol methyltransferase n=1 Tax=Coleophoma cylindrospora TaxID=1849047 RepID=A0A3D8S721_9HELO|nr:hypothetical protein BP6252_03195 [Coleophoma cylindrospora]